MIQWFCLLCLGISFLSVLQAEDKNILGSEDSMIVNSGEAQYDGKEMTLIGQVVVQHLLGQISARRLSFLSASHPTKKNKWGFLTINDDVQLELKEGGWLYCQQAKVDYANMQGFFTGNAEQPDVTYLNTGEEKKGSQHMRPALEVKSHQMICDLLRESSTSTVAARTLVKQIEAIQNVRVHYNQDQFILADHALYQRLSTPASALNAGLLTLSVRGKQPFCQLTNLNGDRLQAQTIQVNTVDRELWLERPEGMLQMHQEKPPSQTLEFASDELIWEGQKETLWLKGHVKITQNGTFHLQTDHEISIIQAFVNGKKTLRLIQAPKQTQISYSDTLKGNTHKINCPGSLTIDHERQEMTMESLADFSEQMEEHAQVYIEDLLGEMYADRVHMTYSWKDRQLIPEKITLEGHVRILNRFDGHPEESGSVLHYALADRVDYLIKQQEMNLSSTQGQRVLFFDKVNHIQMSAPSLKIRHDVTTHKDSVQGEGDVRFTFMEKELEQIKKQFHLEDPLVKERDHAP